MEKKKGKADILLCVKHFCHILIHGFSPSPLAGDFPGAGSETITLKEGEDLNLRCTLSSDGSSARQWLNPHDFSIFLDTHRGKCENWRQHFPRGAGGSLRGGLSMARLTQLLPNRSRWFHTQPLSAGSWWNGTPHKSGLALELLPINHSYHRHQETSTKTHSCLTSEMGEDVPESPGCSSAHRGIRQAVVSNMCWQSQSYTYYIRFYSLYLTSICPYLPSFWSEFNSSARWGLPICTVPSQHPFLLKPSGFNDNTDWDLFQ